MDDLISRAAAIEEIQNAYCDTECGKDWCAVWKNKGLYEALRILEDVPPAKRWIPVAEPPEKKGYYLVYLDDDSMEVGLWAEHHYFGKFEWRVSNWKEVTHWRELPEPPKEEP